MSNSSAGRDWSFSFSTKPTPTAAPTAPRPHASSGGCALIASGKGIEAFASAPPRRSSVRARGVKPPWISRRVSSELPANRLSCWGRSIKRTTGRSSENFQDRFGGLQPCISRQSFRPSVLLRRSAAPVFQPPIATLPANLSRLTAGRNSSTQSSPQTNSAIESQRNWPPRRF